MWINNAESLFEILQSNCPRSESIEHLTLPRNGVSKLGLSEALVLLMHLKYLYQCVTLALAMAFNFSQNFVSWD
jgi:hypothetical protein